MVRPPAGMNAYEFVVMAAQRAQQLLQGCVPRIEGNHKAIVLAQMEVSTGVIGHATGPDAVPDEITDTGDTDTQEP